MFDQVRRLYRAGRALYAMNPESHETIAYQFEQHAAGKRAGKTFLLYRDQRFSYDEANRIVNRYASAYSALGLAKGDTVALVMENRPEYLWHYLAAGKLGVIISLINTHNIGKPLIHSLRICKPKLIIVGSEVVEHYEAIRAELGVSAPTYLELDAGATSAQTLPDWALQLSAASEANPPQTSRQQLSDFVAYIYTSGTTGLPKAAFVRNQRMYAYGQAIGGLGLGLRDGDVVYNCLPLYHSNSIAVSVSSVITYGVSLALARKFSARHFWEDVRKYNATNFIYIGELCRYLMNQPVQPNDRDNKIRAITGNGLRPDIWKRFQERFGIEHVREFYGSTEGNIGTLNFDNTVGSVGRLLAGGTLVRYDDSADEFVRGPDGFLVKCKPGQPGVLIGRIDERARFDGYHDAKATEQKVIHNAFKQGDAWFNTGDMLRMDWTRRLYFVDRMGDSFRWKGENVSTVEVQEQLSSWPAAAETNVYGVRVSGTEGRAGMASVVLKEGSAFDPNAFKLHVESSLPPYARPLFVRVRTALEITSTFKHKKDALRAEGFDPHKVSDPVYFRDPASGDYTAMTEQLYADVVNGRLRL
jgi:acyl-CoA synthetase (AMP-forming)/AMP-acid ligase II